MHGSVSLIENSWLMISQAPVTNLSLLNTKSIVSNCPQNSLFCIQWKPSAFIEDNTVKIIQNTGNTENVVQRFKLIKEQRINLCGVLRHKTAHLHLIKCSPKLRDHHRRGGEKMLKPEIGKDQRKTVYFRYNRITVVMNLEQPWLVAWAVPANILTLKEMGPCTPHLAINSW